MKPPRLFASLSRIALRSPALGRFLEEVIPEYSNTFLKRNPLASG